MIFITQLIYIHKNQQAVFLEFEQLAIPIIAKYNGQLMLRVKPDDSSYIISTIEKPYEIHIISFATEQDFEQFMLDETRKSFLHLKQQAIKESFLIKGKKYE